MLPDTFSTTRLLLRPVAVEDTDAIFDTYGRDEEVARYVIWRPHRNRRETQTYIERCIATPHAVERTYMLVGCDDNLIRGAFAFASALRIVLIAAMCWHAVGGAKG
jgi:RimJ/RimL family protein N-acetyltransferase